MTHYRLHIWTQWDRQENARRARIEEEKQTQAWVELNNLYLCIERGEVPLTITIGNQLRSLLSQAYPDSVHEHVIRDYWYGEFMKLPGWHDV